MKIVYKIITPIFILAIFPVLFFLPILHLNITSSLAGSLSSNLGIPEYTSLYQLVKMGGNMNETQSALWKTIGQAFMDKDSTIGSMFTNTKWLYVFAVFAGLMILFALVTAVLSIVTRRYGITLGFSLASLVSAFAMNKSFNAFAHPLLTGEISVSSLLSGSDTTGILSNLLGSLAKVESLELAVAYSMTFFLLACAAVLTVVMVFMKRADPKAFKKVKKEKAK